MDISEHEERILKGALGLWVSDKPYRHHFRVPVCGPTKEVCDGMAHRGLLTQPKPGTDFFYVTEAGAAAVGHKLPT